MVMAVNLAPPGRSFEQSFIQAAFRERLRAFRPSF
jgi:hypothetical protein